MQGAPRTMQRDPRYGDVASEVAAFLEERLRFAVDAGIDEERICLDPGIGFGKTAAHNFELVRRLDVLLALGRPVVIGFSRKRSLGRLVGDADATTGSVAASVGAAIAAYERGAAILRVHDVREHAEALAALRAVESRVSPRRPCPVGTWQGSDPGRSPSSRAPAAESANDSAAGVLRGHGRGLTPVTSRGDVSA